MATIGPGTRDRRPDGRAAWRRLAAATALSTFGGAGMWTVVVALPAVQAEFGASRSEAALSYVLTMVGFAVGGVLFGKLSDRTGIVTPALAGALLLATGYVLIAAAPSLPVYALLQGALVGTGMSASFAPLIADISQWFDRRRGIAVSICASGNYAAGALWPPITQWSIDQWGWRSTHAGIGIVCLCAMLPLIACLRVRLDAAPAGSEPVAAAPAGRLAVSPPVLQALLVVAGVACCVAMSMPQVHIVAYCGDLGYGAARGAEMLALMLAFGIVSRIGSGFLADRIGGLPTVLVGSALQGVALLLYSIMDGLGQLYVVSALFGLFQGGIVPGYAIIVREYFPAKEAGFRVSLTITATVVGMAFGGWFSGVLYDLTGSYRAAFVNGLVWNLGNAIILAALLIGRRPARPPAPALA